MGDIEVEIVNQPIPFQEITLQRKMKLYKTALGLTIAQPGIPDMEFFFILFQGSSHQSFMRRALGDNLFRNLNNIVRGQHKPVDTRLLKAKLGTDPMTLFHGNKKGHLFPHVIEKLIQLESYSHYFYINSLSKKIFDSNSGETFDESEVWWGKQTISLSRPSYEFVDRLLSFVLTKELIELIVEGCEGDSITWPSTLADYHHHPIGNWINYLMAKLGSDSYPNFEATLIDLSNGDISIPESRLRKWSAGTDLMPVKSARKIAELINCDKNIYWSFFNARTYALCIDFICATSLEDYYKDQTSVRQLIHKRALHIERVAKLVFTNEE